VASQLVDDVLDFDGQCHNLVNQLSRISRLDSQRLCLVAAEECPELEPLIDRKFKEGGDVDRAVGLVFPSSGMELVSMPNTRSMVFWLCIPLKAKTR
jgi:hexaprenyl-diphosphate synthase